MPTNSPSSPSDKPPGVGWRGAPKTQPRSGRPATQKAGGWTKRKDRDYERAALRRRAKIAFWSLLFVVLVVGFIVWVSFRPVRPPLIVATAVDYDWPLPPNAWASEDAERLGVLHDEEIVTYSRLSWESGELASSLRRTLADPQLAKPGGPRKDVVIIYLSAHGVVDGDNQPCLLPPRALALESARWLKLSTLLEDLFRKDGPGKLPDKVKKVLILDCNRMDANWSMGLLYNGFADRLRAVVEQANIPNLVVLNSAGPGQIAWAAPELGSSVFGYFLWQGLEGAADAEADPDQPGSGDGKVTLRELHDYLTARVRGWVRENRADVQEPMLLPADADFPLVYAQAPKKTTIPEPQTGDDSLWQDIDALWLTHSDLEKRIPYRLNPLGWDEFQQKLLWLEQLAEAGKAYAERVGRTRGELDGLAISMEDEFAAGDLLPYSLPLGRRLQNRPSDKELAAATAALTKALQQEQPAEKPPPDTGEQNGTGQPNTDVNKAVSEPETGGEAEKTPDTPGPQSDPNKTADKPESEAPPQKPPERPKAKGPQTYGYFAAAAAVWDRFGKDAARDELSGMFEFVERADRERRADVIELHFLRMLDSHLDSDVWDTGLDRVKQAVTARDLAEKAAAPAAARDLAEKAAAPADVRAHYWVRQTVDEADDERRRAEDHLFAGSDKALAEAVRCWAQLSDEGEYQAAVRRAGDVARAFQTRDEAWAKTPYLAQWLLARPHESGTQQLDSLSDLIESTHQLGAQLDQFVNSGQWPAGLETTRQNVAGKLRALEQAFGKQCSDLGRAGPDRRKLREIGSVLALPLVTGAQRNELRSNYRMIVEGGEASGTGRQVALARGTTEEAHTTELTDAGRRHLERLAQWQTHPALAILGRAKLEELEAGPSGGSREGSAGKPPPGEEDLDYQAELKRLAEQGGQVRQLLRTVADEAKRGLAETGRILKAQPGSDPSPAEVRAGYSRADRLVRAAAPMLGRQPWSRAAGDPVHLLSDLDLHYLLLWQAERTLHDFWGPTPAASTPQGETLRTPFFEIVAREYLDSAKGLCPSHAALRQGKDPVSRLFALRREAARDCVQPVKPEKLFVDPKKKSSEHGFSVTLADHLPGGTAAVYVEDDAPGRLVPLLDTDRVDGPGWRRKVLSVERAGTEPLSHYWIANTGRLDNPSPLYAVALYRGHKRSCPVYPQPVHGLDIVYQPPDPRKPKVTVYGQARQRRSLVFILDFSGSMLKHLGGDESKPRRITEAVSALKVILSKLAASEEPYHVGVMFYGHRVGWNPQVRNQIVVWNRKPRPRLVPRPAGLDVHPSADVQWILEPGRFTETENKYVNDALDSHWPLGVTPLYLAILRAMNEFRTADDRHIVVITDGFNNQRSQEPPPPVGALKDAKDVEDALKLAGNRNVRLDILGFELEAKTELEKRGRKELKGLLREDDPINRRGAFHYASDPATLRRALEESLELRRYEVRSEGTGRIAAGPVDLGTTCEIDQAADRKQRYLARVPDPDRPAQAPIEVQQGEWLKLYLQDDPYRRHRRLVYGLYMKELREFDDQVSDPLDSAGNWFCVATHIPHWKGAAARFYVSLQNVTAKEFDKGNGLFSSRFSPWPAEAWVRIEPDPPPSDPNAPAVYRFYDMEYKPDCTVPVLSCLAPNWPGAKQAKVQLWCKLQPTTADDVLTVDQLRQSNPEIEGVTNVSFDLETKRGAKPGDPYQVILTERHPAGADIYTLKVEMVPAPEKVIHRYSPNAGTVRHTFFYDDSVSTQIGSYKVRFTSRARLFDKAITCKPLTVVLGR